MSSELTALEKLVVVQECTQLISRFAERNDARDHDAVADMFVEDGVFVRPSKPDQPYVGRETIREGFRARPANLATRHLIVNIVVTPVSATEARARSYTLLYTAPVPESGLPRADAKQLIGLSDDRLVRDRDGEWKFVERIGSLVMSAGG